MRSESKTRKKFSLRPVGQSPGVQDTYVDHQIHIMWTIRYICGPSDGGALLIAVLFGLGECGGLFVYECSCVLD